MTKIVVALLFAVLTFAPFLVAQAEAQDRGGGLQHDFQQAKEGIKGAAKRFGHAVAEGARGAQAAIKSGYYSVKRKFKGDAPTGHRAAPSQTAYSTPRDASTP